jgi:DNA-binding CsgD family transcriptional regulator
MTGRSERRAAPYSRTRVIRKACPIGDLELGAPRGLRAAPFRLGEDELVVFSFPLAEPVFPDVLSASERDVALGVLQGLSNAEISAARGTSLRTVVNQVAAIFRKLDISSRAELPRRLLRTMADGEAGQV